jgi:hypothetical protein
VAAAASAASGSSGRRRLLERILLGSSSSSSAASAASSACGGSGVSGGEAWAFRKVVGLLYVTLRALPTLTRHHLQLRSCTACMSLTGAAALCLTAGVVSATALLAGNSGRGCWLSVMLIAAFCAQRCSICAQDALQPQAPPQPAATKMQQRRYALVGHLSALLSWRAPVVLPAFQVFFASSICAWQPQSVGMHDWPEARCCGCMYRQPRWQHVAGQAVHQAPLHQDRVRPEMVCLLA